MDVPDLDVDGQGPAAKEEKMSTCMRLYVKAMHLVSHFSNFGAANLGMGVPQLAPPRAVPFCCAPP